MMPVTHDGPGPQHRRARRLIWTGAVLVIVGVLPLLSVWLSSTIAEAAGCELNEAAAHRCLIGGVDLGGLLSTMFVAGWLMLVSLPAAAVGLVVLVIGLLARRRG